MTSTTAQFAPSRGMGIYESLYQMNMWEDTFRSDIRPTGGERIATQVDPGLENKSKSTSSYDPLGPSVDGEEAKSLSDKVQRRLAQNREAARKSHLRKKAYVQQLETSRLKLAQLELEHVRARQQGMYVAAAAGAIGFGGTVNSGIAEFGMEYSHWIEEQQKKTSQLRTALQSPLTDMELRILVEHVLNHYNDLFRMKTVAAKADALHLVTGMWGTSVERFFLWIGGFRPSEIINIVLPQLEPLTDQQNVDVSNLLHSCQQAEDALSQGMDKLQQTLTQSILTGAIGAGSYGCHLASSTEMLESLERFLNQADHLRQETLQQMSHILRIRQAARGLLAFGEYFQRLRALSSLRAARPREPAYHSKL